jgi:hypothetical protein
MDVCDTAYDGASVAVPVSLRQPGLLDRLLKAREFVRHAGAMLVAKLGRREATLDHRHQRLAVAFLEAEFGLVLDKAVYAEVGTPAAA